MRAHTLGDAKLDVDPKSIPAGGEVTITGPPDAVVHLGNATDPNFQAVTLDANGKAKVVIPGPGRVVEGAIRTPWEGAVRAFAERRIALGGESYPVEFD